MYVVLHVIFIVVSCYQQIVLCVVAMYFIHFPCSSLCFMTFTGPSGLGNAPPGSVVDRDCVHKDWYDFFLVSQSVRQGKC